MSRYRPLIVVAAIMLYLLVFLGVGFIYAPRVPVTKFNINISV